MNYIKLILISITFLTSCISIGQIHNPQSSDMSINCYEVTAVSHEKLTDAEGKDLYPSIQSSNAGWSRNLSFKYVHNWSINSFAAEAYFNEKQFTGKLKVCNNKGVLVYICNYKDGKANGEFSIYSDQGKLLTTGKFLNGKLDGEILDYNPITGIVDSKTTYTSNILDGLSIRNYNNGEPFSEIKYEKGKAVRGRDYFRGGQKSYEWKIVKDTQDEVFTYYYENGNRKKTGTKRMPIDGPPTMQGKWTWFNEDGTMIKSKDCTDIILECDGWDCEDFDNSILNE